MATKKKKKAKKECSSSKKDSGSRPSLSCSSVIPSLPSMSPSLQQINEGEGIMQIRPDSPLLSAPPPPTVPFSEFGAYISSREIVGEVCQNEGVDRPTCLTRGELRPPARTAILACPHVCTAFPYLMVVSGRPGTPQPPAPSIGAASQASSSACAAVPPSWPAPTTSAPAASANQAPAASANQAPAASAKPAPAAPSS
ncbi:tropomyosin-1, isoforms 33/34-like [Palaemon carinicauda]|uniref:tropomyosin-1, isoforms 33/34-like n=1 Tax=Palaemon carinicauda TaxID=392227 RepID=UPI0035B57682